MIPILSIIIPCYNHGQYIQDTLDSIKEAKSNFEIEIIIINDGSTDGKTISKLKEIESRGYNVISQINSGLGAARNTGIKAAIGKYILPLDSDNMVLKPYLNDAIELLEQDDFYDIVYGDAFYFGEKSGEWIVGEYNLLKLIPSNYIDACAVFRKSVWEKVGGYDEKIPKMGVEDWDFWLNCSFNGFRFYYLQKPCFRYRVLSTSMIQSFSSTDNKQVKEFIQNKYKKFTDLPAVDFYFGKKLCSNNNFLAKNITANSLIKILFLKLFLKLKK